MKVAEARGWTLVRSRGDHFIYRHPDIPGNLAIPGHRELKPGVLRTLIRTMDLSVDEFLALVREQ